VLGRWRAERARRDRAGAFVRHLVTEPASTDAAWLAECATNGDIDHATWELRYARRAAGLIVARRDALDDRTASLVSGALSHATRLDPLIDSAKRHTAARQLNTRLAAYSEAVSARDPGSTTGDRLGRTLLSFAGLSDPPQEDVVRAGQIVAAYLSDAHDALRRAFGAADLPPDVPPSQLQAQHSAARRKA
jgi:hypothetical protein